VYACQVGRRGAGLVGSVAGGEVANAWGYPAALSLGAAAVAAGRTIFAAKVARRPPPGARRPVPAASEPVPVAP
jgi:hypothetical protein